MALTQFQLYTGLPTQNSSAVDPLVLHRIVRESCLPNCMGIQVPGRTNPNVVNFRHFLVDYWDDQLVDLLKFGFPLDFDGYSSLISIEGNHKSAIEYEEQALLARGIRSWGYYKPFQNKPIVLHISPFMTRDKPDSQCCHTIIYLSWPCDASFNVGVQKDIYLESKFVLRCPSVDHIVNK